MPDQQPEQHSETINFQAPSPADLSCIVQSELSDTIALVTGTSRVVETIAQLNSGREAQMKEIAAAGDLHDVIMAGIDAKLRRSHREPTDRHQLLVGLGVWAVLSFAAAFAFHTLGADLAQIEIDLVIADFTFVVAGIFWIVGTTAIGMYREKSAATSAASAREVQVQQLAADVEAAERSIREIDATLDRIRARMSVSLTREPAAGATRINPTDGAEMVYVPAGEFTMGMQDREIEEIPSGLAADETSRGYYLNCIRDNGPRREVHLDGYWIYRYPVTVGQYRRYCTETGAVMPRNADAIEDDLGDRHPIDHLTWHAAKAFCDWAHVRLCTEAEWEKAMRGTRGQRFPWGDVWDPSLPSRTDDWSNRTPAEAFDDLAGPYGAVDFYSESSQWCDDLYVEAAWAVSPGRNPRGPAHNTNGERVIRGGGCGEEPMAYVVAKRFYSDPLRAGQCGIRPVSDT